MDRNGNTLLEAVGAVALAAFSVAGLVAVIAPGAFFSVLGGGLAGLGGLLLRLAFGGR